MTRAKGQQRKSDIASAALELFSRSGLHGVTIDELAGRVGMSKPNLLYYFPSKVSLHRQLVKSSIGQCVKCFMNKEPLAEMENGSVELVRGFWLMQTSFPDYLRFLTSEIVDNRSNQAMTIGNELAGAIVESGDFGRSLAQASARQKLNRLDQVVAALTLANSLHTANASIRALHLDTTLDLKTIIFDYICVARSDPNRGLQ